MTEANEFRKLMEAISSDADQSTSDDHNDEQVDEGLFNGKVSPLEQACRLGLQSIRELSSMLEVLRDDIENKEIVITGVDGSPDELLNHINERLEYAAEHAQIIRRIQKTGKY